MAEPLMGTQEYSLLVSTLFMTLCGLGNSLAHPSWYPRVPSVGWVSWISWCDSETQQGPGQGQ